MGTRLMCTAIFTGMMLRSRNGSWFRALIACRLIVLIRLFLGRIISISLVVSLHLQTKSDSITTRLLDVGPENKSMGTTKFERVSMSTLRHRMVLYKHKIIVFGGFYDTLREVRIEGSPLK